MIISKTSFKIFFASVFFASLCISFSTVNKKVYKSQNVFLNSDIIGLTVPNLSDSTLLKVVYGKYDIKDGTYQFNLGPQIWDESDSVYMEVKERLGNDSLQIIYIRGEMAITASMHNFYNETCLLLYKVPDGWKIIDAKIDEQIIDYSGVEYVTDIDGKLLLNYKTFGVYAGGIEYGEDSYFLVSNMGFSDPSIQFTTGSSNVNTLDCMPENNEACECHSIEGNINITSNEKWKCLQFDYTATYSKGDCLLQNARDSIYRQTWLMNGDTTLLIEGNPIADFGNEIKPYIKLSEEEIERIFPR